MPSGRWKHSGFPRGLLDLAAGVAGVGQGERSRSYGATMTVKVLLYSRIASLKATFSREMPSFQKGEDMKLAERSNREKQIHCLELCFIPLEMTVLYFYVNNSQQRGVCKGVKREYS